MSELSLRGEEGRELVKHLNSNSQWRPGNNCPNCGEEMFEWKKRGEICICNKCKNIYSFKKAQPFF
jgi:hypothetical protein